MMKIYCTLVLFLMFCSGIIKAENPGNEIRLNVVKQVIEGYNNLNYKAIKKPWSGLGKIVLSKKALQKEFEPFYNKNGKAIIDTITSSSRYEYTAKLIMEKNPTNQVYMAFMFNDNNKIEGMGFAYPPMVYKKSHSASLVSSDFAVKVDSMINQKYLISKTKPFNGCVMVLDQGKPIYQNNFGYTDYNTKEKLNDSTLFEMASCSKQFTATAILILAQRGKLNLTDTLQKFIPDFPYHNITIENLLTHTSGLPDYDELLAKKWDKTKFATNADVIEQLKKYKPKVFFKPNERFMYSNTGFVILSAIIEKVSGMTYNDFLDASIFKPLHMSRTRVYNTRRFANEKIANYAYGYIYSNEQKKYILPDSSKEYNYVIYEDRITGDGSVNSCIRDLALWENELLNPTLLNRNYMEKAFTRHTLNNGEKIDYGYGFFISGGGTAEKLIYHTGGWPGYVTIIMHFPELQKAIIILSNNEFNSFTRMADDIAVLLNPI